MAYVTEVRTGLWYGSRFALAFSAIAVVLLVFGGDRAFRANDTTFWRVLGAYWFGGLGGGILVGVLWPLLSSRLGSVLVGAITGVLVAWGIGVSMYPASTWFSETLVDALELGSVMGGLAAYFLARKP